MQEIQNDAVKSIMAAYTPVEVKTLLHNHDEKCFVHHQDPKDIVQFYHDHFEDMHHWLLDDVYAFQFYIRLQAAYNEAQEGEDEESMFAIQTLFIKDVVYLFIATVVWDLAQSHDLLNKTISEVEDYQLNIDLDHRKKQLQVIDGGKS